MFKLFAKNKLAVVIVALVIAAAVTITVSGVILTNGRRLQFPADGYTLMYEDGGDSIVVPNQVRFAKGAAVSGSSIDSTTFLHFDDNSISSLYGMTLVDLDEYTNGLMDSYYLGARQILSESEGTYRIDNNNSTLEFNNFILKTGDQNYLMYSPTISLQQNNSGSLNTTNDSFVEVTYLDEDGSVARISDGTNACQILTDGANLVMDNGSILDLGTMELSSAVMVVDDKTMESKISLADIEVSLDVNTNINVINDSADSWLAPTFIINPINGADGISGDEGANGDNGDNGENGADGADGADGEEGADGDNGTKGATAANGGVGANGRDGDNTDEEASAAERALAPCVTITSWSQDAGSFSFKFVPYNFTLTDAEENTIVNVKAGSLKAYVINTKTSKVIAEWNESQLTSGGTAVNEVEYHPDCSAASLNPGTAYKMVMEATDSSGTGKIVLLSRTFTTDDNGLYLQKVDSGYISTDATVQAYTKKYDDALSIMGRNRISKKAFLGLNVTLPGGQQISNIDSVEITYKSLTTGETGTDSRFDYEELGYFTTIAQNGDTYPLDGLETNSEYTIRMNATLSTGEKSEITETYLTVKASPSIRCARFDVSSGKYFISYVDFNCTAGNDQSTHGIKSDADGAIAYYTHDIYACTASGTIASEAPCLKSRRVYNTSVPTANIYVGDAILQNSDSKTYYYKNIIYVTWFDNEKYVTTEVQHCSEHVDACSIAESDSPYIIFSETDNGVSSNAIVGRIYVYPGEGNNIYVGDNSTHRLTLQINSANAPSITYWNNLSEWKYASGAQADTALVDSEGNVLTSIPTSGAYIEINLSGLSRATNYTMTVIGCMDKESTITTQVGSTDVMTLD